MVSSAPHAQALIMNCIASVHSWAVDLVLFNPHTRACMHGNEATVRQAMRTQASV